MELGKGQTIMVDADLQQPSRTLHKDVCSRSGLPADSFELYHGSKPLEDEAPLASWGVKKSSLIEVKMRGRGGMQTAGGEGSGVAGLDVAGGGSSSGESVEGEEAQTEGAADTDAEIERLASIIYSHKTSPAPEPTKGPDPEAAPRTGYDIGVSAQALWEYLCSLLRRAVRSGQLVGGG